MQALFGLHIGVLCRHKLPGCLRSQVFCCWKAAKSSLILTQTRLEAMIPLATSEQILATKSSSFECFGERFPGLFSLTCSLQPFFF